MEKTLKKDQMSRCKDKTVYAKKGERVRVVNTNHGKVAIVSNSRGERFPVLKDELE